MMEFPVSTSYYFEGPSQDDLLATFMSSEIDAWGTVLDDYPSMVAEEFDASASTSSWQTPLSGFSGKIQDCFGPVVDLTGIRPYQRLAISA